MSGGIDSSVLLWEMTRRFDRVYPFYVRSGFVWEKPELLRLKRFHGRMRSLLAQSDGRRGTGSPLQPLRVVDLPLKDIYPKHWSLTGRGTPAFDTKDDAVYLPGRNLILLSKAAVLAALGGVGTLALGILKANPFPDGSRAFLDHLASAMGEGLSHPLTVLTPYAQMTKSEVIARGEGLPLELTFSCISPKKGLHCGDCNKCGERIRAFRTLGRHDATRYHRRPPSLDR